MAGARRQVLAVAALAAIVLVVPAASQAEPAETVDRPAGVSEGDPVRGRLIVADRKKGLCLLCHSGPFPEERFQGTLAPSLTGAGARLTEGQLRLRMVDSARVNPASLMPAYGRGDGFVRVGQAWRDRPILTPGEIEDVVAFLMQLRD